MAQTLSAHPNALDIEFAPAKTCDAQSSSERAELSAPRPGILFDSHLRRCLRHSKDDLKFSCLRQRDLLRQTAKPGQWWLVSACPSIRIKNGDFDNWQEAHAGKRGHDGGWLVSACRSGSFLT
jgi:hypothetical protein